MINTKTYPNGLTLVYEQMPFVNTMCFGVWIRNGSRNETLSTNGISHFIEHMLFKGTSNRSAKDIASEMDAIGGQMNAFTSKEYTCYYARTLSTHIEKAIDIISDMFLNSSFNEADITKECNVIMEEIDMYLDAPDDLVVDKLMSNVFKNQMLGHPIQGSKESVQSFDKNILCDYFSKNYHPENTVISIAGKFEVNHILELVDKYFYNFKRDFAYKPNFEPAIYDKCIIKHEKDIEQVHLIASFEGLKREHENIYALSLFNTVFGRGMSSRLFQTIREMHGLSYSIYSYHANYKDNGLFNIYSALNASQLHLIIDLIIKEIKNLQTDKITDDMLKKAKEQLKSNYLMGLESTYNKMSAIGSDKLLCNKVTTDKELIEKIDVVSIEKIYETIDLIFDLDKISFSILGNINNIDIDGIIKNAL